MSLDENHPLWEHSRDRDQAQMAALRQFEQEDREARWAEMRERDDCESVEATEQMWAGVFAQQPSWMKDTIYELDRG